MEEGILTSVVLPISMMIVMFGMGLSLVVDDFKRIIKYPKATFLGLVNQLVILPLLAFIMVVTLEFEPILAVGFMLIAACPGGVSSNMITHLSRGDTALSITLTAFSSCLTVITIPLIISFSQNYFFSESQTVQLPLLKTIMQILIITALPVSIGMFIRNKFSDFAIRMDKPTRVVSSIILILVLVVIVISYKEMFANNALKLGGYSLILLIGTIGFGFFSARFFKLNLPQSISIAVETGIQNGTLAVVIASSILNQPELSIPAAIYCILMFGPAIAMIWYFGRRKEYS